MNWMNELWTELNLLTLWQQKCWITKYNKYNSYSHSYYGIQRRFIFERPSTHAISVFFFFFFFLTFGLFLNRFYTVSQKRGDAILLSISLLIDRFSQFFHRRTQLKICNKITNKDPTSPQMCLHYLVKCSNKTNCTGAQGTRDNQAVATGDAGIHLTWSVASE